MMNFKILGYADIQDFENTVKEPHILIFFRTPSRNYQPVYTSERCFDFLGFCVHDIHAKDTEAWQRQGGVFFTRENANQILDFVDKYKNQVDLIVTQCDMGISRSSGVAAALSKILNGNNDDILNNLKFVPNDIIYKLILEEYRKRNEIQPN